MKLWGGRFEKEVDRAVHRYSSSLAYDRRLAPYDIRVSMVHAAALEGCGVLSAQEKEEVVRALRRMEEELEEGTFPFAEDEDIHSAVERVLVERLGGTGAKLRTARSRNDQVAADMRLYVMDEATRLARRVVRLMETLLQRAEEHLDVPLPGFTHLQPAQPLLLSHQLMAYFHMFGRDLARFEEARGRADSCPLGSGALAGVTFPLDRGMMAEELGFSGITANSVDAVSDRDFVLDLLFAAVTTAVHLSRMAEDFIFWCNPSVGFLRLDEAHATGSSIMPQKANPDVLELARAKAGRAAGHLLSLVMVLKGLPLAYNRDLQEDKEGLFDAVDQLHASLEVMTGLVATAVFDTVRMRGSALAGYANATDLADYLVRRGVPFLEAHRRVGVLVRRCLERGIELVDLTLEEMQEVEPLVGEDVYEHISLEGCLRARDLPGGTAPSRVEEEIGKARRWLKERRAYWLGVSLERP